MPKAGIYCAAGLISFQLVLAGVALATDPPRSSSGDLNANSSRRFSVMPFSHTMVLLDAETGKTWFLTQQEGTPKWSTIARPSDAKDETSQASPSENGSIPHVEEIGSPLTIGRQKEKDSTVPPQPRPKKSQPALSASVGCVNLRNIAAESLIPHLDTLRAACSESWLILDVDKSVNMLMFVTSPDALQRTTKSIRQWLDDVESGRVPISLVKRPAPKPLPRFSYMPTQQEVKRRTDALRRTFPARYSTLEEPQVAPLNARPIDIIDVETRQRP